MGNSLGIPKDSIDSLFKKFYQLDTLHTRKHGGSGLGFTICRDLEIWAEKSDLKVRLEKELSFFHNSKG